MLITAIFVMVVLALLGLAMVRLTSTGAQNVVYEVYGQHALNAARSGLELKLTQAFPLNGAPVLCTEDVDVTTLNIGGLQSCGFQAACQQIAVNFPNGQNHTRYQFSSSGSCEFDGQRVVRTLAVEGLSR